MTFTPERPLRWGILGCGSIANNFATGLQSVPEAKLQSAASRTPGKADTFADKFGAPTRHTDYESLAHDPDVDVVYVATPHPMHAEHAILCLNAKKAVLCEKPFTVNAAQAQAVIDAAGSNNVFCMEAMWSRFFPAMRRVHQLVKDGAIGDLRMVQADFGFRAGVNPEGRLFNPALAGGGLLDVGVYCVSLASLLLGTPTQVTGVAEIGETGVDEQAALALMYDGGRIASITTGVRTTTPHVAFLLGTDGSITLPAPWWKPTGYILNANGKEETVDVPFVGQGMNYQAQEVAACLAAGKTESDIMPLDETLSIIQTLDTLRALWGLRYPME